VPRAVLRSLLTSIPAYKSSESAMLRYRGRSQEMGQESMMWSAAVVVYTHYSRIYAVPDIRAHHTQASHPPRGEPGPVPRPGPLYGLLGTTRSMGSLTTLITRLRKLFVTDDRKKYYPFTAPQCLQPDASIQLWSKKSSIGFIWFQFYNNPSRNPAKVRLMLSTCDMVGVSA
jgi:hypothetical protein